MDQLEFIARAIQDQDFRARLKANPKQVAEEAGTDLEGIQLKVVENTADTFHVAMPSNPNDFLEDDALEDVAGGRSRFRTDCGFGGSRFNRYILSSVGTIASTASTAEVSPGAGGQKPPQKG